MRLLAALVFLSPICFAGDVVVLDGSLASLKARFNAGKERVRFVAVVSPT